MAKKLYEESNIAAIADAIRVKNGSSNTYTTSTMPNAILSIITEFDLESLTVSENGSYAPSQGINGFDSVVVSVPVASIMSTRTFSSNGTYNARTVDNVDAYAEVVVDCDVISGRLIDYFAMGIYSYCTEIDMESYSIIRSNAFKWFSNLIKISGSMVTTIENDAFMHCPVLSEVYFPELTNFTGPGCFTGCIGLRTVSFPKLENITEYCFSNCTSLFEAYFPEVLSLSTRAFRDCNSLQIISFPKLINIRSDAFANCTSLSEVYFPEVTSFTGNACFYNCASLQSVSFPKLTNITANAFEYCSSLSEVYFPEVITIEGNNVFHSCNILQKVSFPKLINLGQGAFYNCSSLSEVYMPELISMIGDGPFEGCSVLQSIIFPKLINIRPRAFSRCTSLISLYLFASSICSLSNINAFASTPMSDSTYTGSFGSIFVLESLVDAYKTATNWKNYSNRITAYIPD